VSAEREDRRAALAEGGRRPLIGTLTLGCKLNQAETQALGRELEAAGCRVVDRPAQADGYLINTCTVTRTADAKARRLIRMVGRLSPGAPVVVTGCYAERSGEEIMQSTGASVVVGNGSKFLAAERLLDLLDEGSQGAAAEVHSWAGGAGRTRAFVKIQEGCNDVCAFCIVPRVRGRERAVPIGEVVAAVQEREEAGALEVVLTGTQPGAYGRDRSDGSNAALLIETLLAETSVPRIRYSSIQPQDVTPELLAQWEDGRMCRHFHLALQSGSDRVLGQMRRRYDVAGFRRAVEWIRAAVPGCAITTDVIAGFPGESDAAFEETLSVVKEVGFARAHVFPYSTRPGTSGALLRDDVPVATKQARVRQLLDLTESQATAFRSRLVGETMAVLFESRREEEGGAVWTGLSDTYVPVEVAGDMSGVSLGPDGLRNRIVPVTIVGTRDREGVSGGAGSRGAVTGRVVA